MTPSFGLPAELAELTDEYEFLDELGRGGSAIVYRARDRALGRDVAIKVVHPRPTSPDDDPVARLAREARTVAQLHHPGVVTVYAVRRLHAGGLTLVMQLVPGVTLKASIQRGGPFTPQRAERVLRDVAHALAYAHSRRVIHRDVKPENIFLDEESGRALLADFGIARSTEADSLTMTGTAIGTPFYMSPEQVDGMPVDGRSDLYSLGLVAWEMLTGLRPWDGESLYHVIYKQKHDELPPIEAIRRDVPRRLQYIVERMLQKHPAARWAGADGLLAQLDQTILPADYTQWQAALPGRITRHRAVAGLQRAPSSAAPDPVALAAPTVQFTSRTGFTRDGASTPAVGAVHAQIGGEPSAFAGPAATAGGDALPRTVAGRELEPTCPAGEDVGVAGSEVAEVATAYDSIAPTWAYPNAATARTAPRWRRRGAAVGAVSAILVGAMASTAKSRDLLPARLTPSVIAPLEPITGAPEAGRSTLAHRWAVRGARPDASAGAFAAGLELAPDLIGVGSEHQCSIGLEGIARCWGDNASGQLGDGSGAPSARLPQPVVGVMTYSGLGAGTAHTCGVTQPGDVYCWGTNDDGQLGDGTTTLRSAPVRVAGTGTYRAVRGGKAHTCALEIEGQIRCWGANDHGQLGTGTWDAQPIPTLVRLPRWSVATALAVGGQHSCALLLDGRVACWGANESGQLGVGRGAPKDEPVIVPGIHASAIAAGDAHTCAVLLSGPVRCWGRDDSGQLGATAPNDSIPGRTTIIPGGEDVRAITAGTAHSCALTRGGWAWCWGRTRFGVRRSALRVGRGPYVALVAGGDRSCALPRGRVVECWLSADVSPHRRSGGPRVHVTTGL